MASRRDRKPARREPAKKPSPRGVVAAAPSTHAWFHPQRGGMYATRMPTWPGADWQDLGEIERGEHGAPARSVKLPKGFLWADSSRQTFGYGGGFPFYGPLSLVCRDCKEPFVLPAHTQRHMYETIGLRVDVRAQRCQPCARVRVAFDTKRNAYHRAGAELVGATTAEPCLALGRTALAFLAVGGHVNFDRAIASVRRARKLGATREADTLEAKLVVLRAATR